LSEDIRSLYKDQSIQNYLKSTLDFTCKYYIQEFNRICDADFIPNGEDFVLSNSRYKQIDFEYNKNKFSITNIGGLRSERNKIKNILDSTCAVIYVANLFDFDQLLLEDSSVSVIQEAISVFTDIVSSFVKKRRKIFLFLNIAGIIFAYYLYSKN